MERDKTAHEAALRKILADDFGIMNNYELAQAIKEMKKANLAIMLVGCKA